MTVCEPAFTRITPGANFCPGLSFWLGTTYLPEKVWYIGILGQVWYLIVSIPDLCTLTYFDCRNAILRSSATFLGTSYSQIVVAVLLYDTIFERTLR